MSWTSPLTVASSTLPCAPCVSVHSRLPCTAAGRPPRASSHARTSPPAAGNIRPEPEEVADHAHAVHQGALDHVLVGAWRFRRASSVSSSTKVDDAVDERPLEPLGKPAPRAQRRSSSRLVPSPRNRSAISTSRFRRVGTAVEEGILDALEQLRVDVLVHRELARVDDPPYRARRGSRE